MPIMSPVRALWYSVKAYTDVVGTFGPPPIGSVVAFFLQSPTAPGASEQVAPIRLGVYVASEEQLQSILPFFWGRLQQLVTGDGFEPSRLGPPFPPLSIASRYGEIAAYVFSRYNPVGPAATTFDGLMLDDADDLHRLPASPVEIGDAFPEDHAG